MIKPDGFQSMMPQKKYCLILLLLAISVSCTQSQQKPRYIGPAGYDLTSPVKYIMHEDLSEISGITFNKGNADTLYAEQDEDGRLFYFHPGDKKPLHVKFAKHGDYEDVAILDDRAIVLKSNGTLYVFPLVSREGPADVKEISALLPDGEYEGMYADQLEHRLYILSKNSSEVKSSKQSPGYVFDMGKDGSLKPAGQFTINVKEIDQMAGTGHLKFRPSAIALNPLTREWYILSSYNKLLVVTGLNWKVKAVYKLDPAVFLQPEGMTFNKKGDLYISNEGDEFKRGNVLLFSFKQSSIK